MDDFRDWIGVADYLPGMLRLYEASVLTGTGPLPLQFPGRHSGVEPGAKVIQPGQNELIPLDSLRPGGRSAFLRDQPYIGAFSQASPDNMAATIIFVLMTIRADFMSVMQDFPVLMMVLMSKFDDVPVDGEGIAKAVSELEGGLLAKSHPATKSKSTTDASKEYRTGYSLGGTFFGTKFNSVANVWNDRDRLYDGAMSLAAKKDTVGLFEFLLQNVGGLAQAKAGFVVQLIFGELGCIDMHNVNLYSQFYLQSRGRGGFRPDHVHADDPEVPAPSKRGREMYAALNPRWFSTKPTSGGPKAFKAAVKKYIDVVKGLEEDGFNTVKLWDIWTAYVAKTYTSKDGKSRYSRTGGMAGNPLDPKDPTDAKVIGVGEVPDRNAVVTGGSKISFRQEPGDLFSASYKRPYKGDSPLPTYSTAGMDKERSAGAASAAHGATWWWRTPDYWWDQIGQARGGEAKDQFRYSSKDRVGPSSVISKPLAYIATDPELMRSVFPEPSERKRFEAELNDVMKYWNFWRTPVSDEKKWRRR